MHSRPLTLVGCLVLAVGCGDAEPAAENHPDAVAADPAHYAVEFENDAVRLLRVTYGPGETSVMHTHPEICSIALSASSWSMTDVDGEVTEEDPTTFGTVACGNEATVHIPTNTGTAASEVVLVELKEGASAGTWTSETPDAVSADPDHYSVEWENDLIRVLRISYGAAEQSVMHHHPANCFVSLSDGTWHMTDSAGEVTENVTPVGTLACGDAEDHIPANAGEETGEVVLIEFKGRETVQ